MEINEREKRFCKEYIACKFNGTQAAINAGYSKKTARNIASQNLTKLHIQQYLAELLKKSTEKAGLDVSLEKTLVEITRLAFVDHRNFFDENGNLKPVHELDDNTAAALAGFEVMEEKSGDGKGKQTTIGHIKKIKTYDKNKSLEILAKYFKMFSDAPVNNNFIQPFTDNQVDKIISSIRENKSTRSK